MILIASNIIIVISCMGVVTVKIVEFLIRKKEKQRIRRVTKWRREQAVIFLHSGIDEISPFARDAICTFINKINWKVDASISDEDKSKLEKEINNGKWDYYFLPTIK